MSPEKNRDQFNDELGSLTAQVEIMTAQDPNSQLSIVTRFFNGICSATLFKLNHMAEAFDKVLRHQQQASMAVNELQKEVLQLKREVALLQVRCNVRPSGSSKH